MTEEPVPSQGRAGGSGGVSPPEQFTDVGRGITLCHQSFGSEGDPPLLLNMGLGMQMLGWPEGFCEALAQRGFFVVRYDNRDAGRSTRIEGVRPPGIKGLVLRSFDSGQYTLADMADDAAGLLRALDLAPAHIVGASLGGMVAQTIAAHHPDVTRTLTSIMSMTGGRFTGQPTLGTYRYLLAKPARDRAGVLDAAERTFGHIGSKEMGGTIELVRERAGLAFDRGYNPAGTGRQLAAILKSGDRSKELNTITAPTLVIHGTADPLVQPSGGKATAKEIPGAELMLVDGMGHDLPEMLWPRFADAIAEMAHGYDESSSMASASLPRIAAS